MYVLVLPPLTDTWSDMAYSRLMSTAISASSSSLYIVAAAPAHGRQ